jgi:hypothetical protein
MDTSIITYRQTDRNNLLTNYYLNILTLIYRRHQGTNAYQNLINQSINIIGTQNLDYRIFAFVQEMFESLHVISYTK